MPTATVQPAWAGHGRIGGPPGSPAGRRFRCRLSAGSLIGRRRFECRHAFNRLWRSGGYPQSGRLLMIVILGDVNMDITAPLSEYPVLGQDCLAAELSF